MIKILILKIREGNINEKAFGGAGLQTTLISQDYRKF
tara:strand:- start:530 stop:640 length:111 start_codon:yes stop_codon:yes gene_type:complete